MGKCVAALMLLVAMTVAACGPAQVPPPAKANSTKPAVNAPAKGKSYASEYRASADAAFEAQKEYEVVRGDTEKRKEPYVKWAEHMYAALAYANMHTANGHSASQLPRLQDIKEMKAGYFKNALGPSDDPRVKAAIKKWSESAGSGN